jgi:capsular polysaccharide export protein
MTALVDRVETTAPMAALIAMVDELHVNSSLAGFEALMRGKPVTVHGAPFYAGWGLTTDLGPMPARRTAKRTLDELVAATLLLYPRYLDPVTGLPCPAEVLVERLAHGAELELNLRQSAIVVVRRLQGRLRARLGRWLG